MPTVRYPQRIDTVHIEAIDDELCVYDTARQRVHSLNHSAAFVWQRCDGRTSPSELSAALADADQIDDADAVVGLALEELSAADLLAEPIDSPALVSRRDLLRRGIAAAALPAIYSIVAPRPAAAQSVITGSAAFGFTGAPVTFPVPAGVFQITIVANGASGGDTTGNPTNTGGLGGRATASFGVTPGTSLTVRVGGVGGAGAAGAPVAGGFNGGGPSNADGASGGGASTVHNGATPIIIAGGGGGAGTPGTTSYVGDAPGGAGGGLTGNPGTSISGGGGGGGGGSQGSGGAAGTAGASPATAGTAGSSGQGGTGGTDGASLFGGGGGGGGYFGGGGGGGGTTTFSAPPPFGFTGGGGGGGSSFTLPGATGVVHQQGANGGNGTVTISW